jgi:2,4-dichlorophenol 6-monooxygenase
VLDRLTGQTLQIRAKYLIGADGGRSRVVEQLGLPLIGKAGLGMAVNIQFQADLSRFVAHRPGVLYWVMQPGLDQWAGGGTLRMVRPWDQWLAIVGHDPSAGEPDLAPERLRRIVLGLIGDESVDITLRGASKWMINHIVAERYSSGRVFCMGDAVHRHPPTNGLGSNTSIQDAFNLAWKLKFVLTGQAGPDLLESYSEERQPVGKQVVDRAIKSLMEYQPITEAIGVRPGQTPEERQAAIEGRKSAGKSAAAQRQAILKGAALKNYEYNALGVELNQVYRSRAIVKMADVEAAPTSDAELHYLPSTRPGARLPHAWLHKGSQRASTHDLVGHGRFTVLVGPEGHQWAAEVTDVSGALGIEVSCFSIGPGCDYEDTYGDWASLREVDDTGCIVVRPDMHVAWRAISETSTALENLRYRVAQALCRQDFAAVEK